VGGDPQLPSEQRTAAGWLNRAAFAAAQNDRYGTAGIGIITGAGKRMIDFSARKTFRLSERFRLQIQSDFFDTLNITNSGNPGVTVADVAYGRIRTADGGRNIQLGTRLTY
jgi:hypothetical protein